MNEFQSLDDLVEEAARVMRLFYHLSPLNQEEQRNRFLARPGPASEPVYRYPELEFDARDLSGRLRRARFPDGPMGRLYRDKFGELIDTLRLLEARGSTGFLAISRSLYGRPPPDLVAEAVRCLQRPRDAGVRSLTEGEVVRQLEAQVNNYRRRYPDFVCEVVVDSRMSANMYVSGHVIHVKRGLSVTEQAAACDRFHEIDAHVLTTLNGRKQPFRLFAVGIQGYLAFQESLGVFSEIINGAMFPGRAATLCARVVAVDAMVRGLGFHDVFALLCEEHAIDPQEACTVCMRVFRGGGFTKDWLYLSKLRGIFDHLAAGRDPGLLLLGKVTLEEAGTIGDLVDRGVLRPPAYLPAYLDEADLSRNGLSERMARSGLFSAE
jgi:uncharacterized protein (TIGR02421 family)